VGALGDAITDAPSDAESGAVLLLLAVFFSAHVAARFTSAPLPSLPAVAGTVSTVPTVHAVSSALAWGRAAVTVRACPREAAGAAATGTTTTGLACFGFGSLAPFGPCVAGAL